MGLACQVGHVSGSGIHGAAIVPVISAGYGRFDICVTGDPFEKDAADKSKVVACFIKFRAFEF